MLPVAVNVPVDCASAIHALPATPRIKSGTRKLDLTVLFS
jgi:hypothetical protein